MEGVVIVIWIMDHCGRGEKINFRFEISDLRLGKSAIYNLKSKIRIGR
jgi:hypothetical protein